MEVLILVLMDNQNTYSTELLGAVQVTILFSATTILSAVFQPIK